MITDKINVMSDNELIERIHKSIINEYGIDGYIYGIFVYFDQTTMDRIV